MLDDQLQLSLLIVRDGGTVALDVRPGDHPAPDRVLGPSDIDGVDRAIAAGCGVPEEGVALLPDHIVGGHGEGLLRSPVHPDDRMLGVMDDYDVVDGVKDHVHELLGVQLLLVHFGFHILPQSDMPVWDIKQHWGSRAVAPDLSARVDMIMHYFYEFRKKNDVFLRKEKSVFLTSNSLECHLFIR